MRCVAKTAATHASRAPAPHAMPAIWPPDKVLPTPDDAATSRPEDVSVVLEPANVEATVVVGEETPSPGRGGVSKTARSEDCQRIGNTKTSTGGSRVCTAGSVKELGTAYCELRVESHVQHLHPLHTCISVWNKIATRCLMALTHLGTQYAAVSPANTALPRALSLISVHPTVYIPKCISPASST
jgi:hypothetical protein